MTFKLSTLIDDKDDCLRVRAEARAPAVRNNPTAIHSVLTRPACAVDRRRGDHCAAAPHRDAARTLAAAGLLGGPGRHHLQLQSLWRVPAAAVS